MASMCDLPADLVGMNILTRVPLTSLRAVRSTCKLWDFLTREWILGSKAAAAVTRKQFSGFMLKDSKVCSVRYHLCDDIKRGKEDLFDLSVKHVDLLNQVKISQISHCDGLLLCLAADKSWFLVWNPYLGQTKWTGLKTSIQRQKALDSYVLGYDIHRNHKILGILHNCGDIKYVIYQFRSSSWRALKVTPDLPINSVKGSVSVKGNAYFFAHLFKRNLDGTIEDIEYFLLCFDFTTERFGPRLPFPRETILGCNNTTLSCIREEQLALIYQYEIFGEYSYVIFDVWVTVEIEPNYVSWANFLRVKTSPFLLTGISLNDDYKGGSIFIDEEDLVAVVFDIYGGLPKVSTETVCDPKTSFFIIGGDDSEVSEDSKVTLRLYKDRRFYYPPVVCSSSYLPSLVQLNQPPKGKEKERDVKKTVENPGRIQVAIESPLRPL